MGVLVFIHQRGSHGRACMSPGVAVPAQGSDQRQDVVTQMQQRHATMSRHHPAACEAAA
jgi:hypothetical protein